MRALSVEPAAVRDVTADRDGDHAGAAVESRRVITGPTSDAASSQVVVTVAHKQAMLGRLAILMNTHDITQFHYSVDGDGTSARVEVRVLGGTQQVNRVVARFRRVVGVTEVFVR